VPLLLFVLVINLVDLASATSTAPPVKLGPVSGLTPNSQIKITVTPMAGKRPGIAASAVPLIHDLAPPVGTFTVTRSGMDATITQTSLSDDATPTPQIKRVVSLGGSPAETWQTGDALTHNFAALGRYVPTITLIDQESLTYNYTPTDLVERTVSWGDDSTDSWPAGAPLTHVYATGGASPRAWSCWTRQTTVPRPSPTRSRSGWTRSVRWSR